LGHKEEAKGKKNTHKKTGQREGDRYVTCLYVKGKKEVKNETITIPKRNEGRRA